VVRRWVARRIESHRPETRAILTSVSTHQIQVEAAIIKGVESLPAIIATLRHLVRHAAMMTRAAGV
jgi:hypothetical protein